MPTSFGYWLEIKGERTMLRKGDVVIFHKKSRTIGFARRGIKIYFIDKGSKDDKLLIDDWSMTSDLGLMSLITAITGLKAIFLKDNEYSKMYEIA